jgi:hypothetical protein
MQAADRPGSSNGARNPTSAASQISPGLVCVALRNISAFSTFRTPKSVDQAVIAAIVEDHPDYNAIKAPALAIYSDYNHADQVPPGTTAQARAVEDSFSRSVYVPWQSVEKARFKLQIPCGRILELKHTGHYLFLERSRETAEWIDSFLASANPCAWVPAASKTEETWALVTAKFAA